MPTEGDGLNRHIHGYAMLQAMRQREPYVTHGSEYAEQKLMAALQDDPVTVTLLDQRELRVHPKSEVTLRWMESQFWWLNWLNVRHEALRAIADGEIEPESPPGAGAASPREMLDAIREEADYRVALLMWCACHEGAGMPWCYGNEPPEEAPAEWMDLNPIEVRRIENAIAEANVTRLHFLPKPKERGKGVAVDVFFAQRAKMTNRPIRELRMDHTLASQIAQTALAGFREDIE